MSVPVFAALETIGERLRAAPEVLLVLDYDGTLAPIAPQPELARLSEHTIAVLRSVARLPAVRTAIVSGRSLEDVKARVRLPLIFAGNHGLEMEGTDFVYRHPEAAARVGDLRVELAGLAHDLAAVPGARVEDKGLTASVHFRNAPPEAEAQVAAIVASHVPEGFRIHAGKKVLELRPDVPWNKGAAACWLLEQCQPGALAVAMGDDLTDEDMYHALPGHITVCVAETRPTQANYRVENVDQALRFLAFCARSLASRASAGPDQRPR